MGTGKGASSTDQHKSSMLTETDLLAPSETESKKAMEKSTTLMVHTSKVALPKISLTAMQYLGILPPQSMKEHSRTDSKTEQVTNSLLRKNAIARRTIQWSLV